VPSACPHSHVKFAAGDAVIVCIDCDMRWHQEGRGMGALAQGVNHLTMPPYDTRHSRWEAPRTEKKKEAK
jgi:hypothetical protein